MSYTIREYRALCEWKFDVCGAIVKMLEENKHYVKFNRTLARKLAEKLGERYHAYVLERSFLKNQLAVIDRKCFAYDAWKDDSQSKLHRDATVHIDIPTEADWNQRMLDDAKKIFKYNSDSIDRLKQEEKIIDELTTIDEIRKASIEACRDKARRLLPKWCEFDHYTYPTREMFPELLRNL